jgi:hypothetical protein
MQGSTETTTEEKRKYTGYSYGKVEFCLPTKLHAPSLADRVIGHMVMRSTPAAYSHPC